MLLCRMHWTSQREGVLFLQGFPSVTTHPPFACKPQCCIVTHRSGVKWSSVVGAMQMKLLHFWADLWGFDLNIFLYRRCQAYPILLCHLALKFMTLLFYDCKEWNARARPSCNEDWMVETLWCFHNGFKGAMFCLFSHNQSHIFISLCCIDHTLWSLFKQLPTNKELSEFKGAKVYFSPL